MRNRARWAMACYNATAGKPGTACGAGAQGGGGAARGGADSLSIANNSTREAPRGGRSRAALSHNVGIEAAKNPQCAAFLTLTIGDAEVSGWHGVESLAEVGRRWNSIRHHIMEWLEWSACVVVPERHKSGDWHLHIFGVGRVDIATGYERGRRANRAIRGQWQRLRERLPAYGFGRHQLEPVKSTGAIGRYLAKYLGKSLADAPRGARMVRYCGEWGARMKATGWSWHTPAASAYRLFRGAILMAWGVKPGDNWPEHTRRIFGGGWASLARRAWLHCLRNDRGVMDSIRVLRDWQIIPDRLESGRAFLMHAMGAMLAAGVNLGNGRDTWAINTDRILAVEGHDFTVPFEW